MNYHKIYWLISIFFQILSDPLAYLYIDGTAVHWYLDDVDPPSALDTAHEQFPDKFILYSEACNGEK